MRGDLQPIFRALALPVVMGEWADDEKPPADFNFIEYHMEGDNNFKADNRAYRRVDVWRVSVYGLVSDMATFYANCEKLEGELDARGIVASRSADIFAEDGIVYAYFTFSLPR